MSRIVDFYSGQGKDSEGRRLADILSWDDEELEMVHDFIQWLFPLPEPSRFNADAPLLTPEDIAAFRNSEPLRNNLAKAFARFLTFLGLTWGHSGQVIAGTNFVNQEREVWGAPNHNWMRLTRVLGSLTLLGLKDQARALYERLQEFYTQHQYPISPDTFQYWTEAVNRRP